ncbi:MAG: hypothetical protein ACLTTZ_02065 [Lachnospiraceae bacterium]
MKKILVFMLTMMMSFGLTACGGGEEQTDPVETEDSSAEEEEAAEEEETEEPEKKEEEADTGDTDVSSAIEDLLLETEAVLLDSGQRWQIMRQRMRPTTQFTCGSQK